MAPASVLPKLVGQRVKRREDPRLIQGRGTYVDDVKIPGMQHLAFKRSDIAHGRIRSIDTRAAGAMDGVEAVFTGAQVAGFLAPMPIGTPYPSPEHRAVAVDTVRFVGDPVAVVVACDRYVARDAADSIVVRAIAPEVGGGFGAKINIYGEEYVAVALSRRLGLPVKWIEDRSEAFLATVHGRDLIPYVELAATRDGKVLGLRMRIIADIGAYNMLLTARVPTHSMTMANATYAFPAVRATLTEVFTNKTPTDAYRGAGRPEATYFVERAMDMLARELGMDPASLRRRNFIQPDQFPYQTQMGAVYDSGDYERLWIAPSASPAGRSSRASGTRRAPMAGWWAWGCRCTSRAAAWDRPPRCRPGVGSTRRSPSSGTAGSRVPWPDRPAGRRFSLSPLPVTLLSFGQLGEERHDVAAIQGPSHAVLLPSRRGSSGPAEPVPDECRRRVGGRHELFLVRRPDDPGDFAEPLALLAPCRQRQVVDLAQVLDHCCEQCVPWRAGQRRSLAQQFGLAFPRQVEIDRGSSCRCSRSSSPSVQPSRTASAYSASRVRPIEPRVDRCSIVVRASRASACRIAATRSVQSASAGCFPPVHGRRFLAFPLSLVFLVRLLFDALPCRLHQLWHPPFGVRHDFTDRSLEPFPDRAWV